jgi:hypothetical protein
MEIFSPVLENSAMDLCLIWSMNFSGVGFFMLLPRGCCLLDWRLEVVGLLVVVVVVLLKLLC